MNASECKWGPAQTIFANQHISYIKVSNQKYLLSNQKYLLTTTILFLISPLQTIRNREMDIISLKVFQVIQIMFLLLFLLLPPTPLPGGTILPHVKIHSLSNGVLKCWYPWQFPLLFYFKISRKQKPYQRTNRRKWFSTLGIPRPQNQYYCLIISKCHTTVYNRGNKMKENFMTLCSTSKQTYCKVWF